MAELPPLPDIFGNYTIAGIIEVLPPDAISWIPSAPGWRFLALALILFTGWRAWLRWRHWQRNRYRAAALKQMQLLVAEHGEGPALLQPLAILLKATALQAYPREEVAQLSGEQWLNWLNQQTAAAKFSAASGNLLGRALYSGKQEIEPGLMQGLLQESSAWIRLHREAQSA